MSKLSTEEREDIRKSKFALPEERKYPIADKAHARNAKARAAQQKAGNMSAADREEGRRQGGPRLEGQVGRPSQARLLAAVSGLFPRPARVLPDRTGSLLPITWRPHHLGRLP